MNNTNIHSILSYVERQVAFFSTDITIKQKIDFFHIKYALEKMSFLFQNIKQKYFRSSSFELSDLFHSDKYAIFLYWLSYALYKDNNEEMATKVYLLNKMLHGIDLLYSRKMPNLFLFSHPVGSILGNAIYQDYLYISQQCTIGGDGWGSENNVKYPTIGRGVALLSCCQIIGNCHIGDNVIFGANTFILNTDIPSNSVVVGRYPNIKILKNKHDVIHDIFNGGIKC